MPFNALFLNKLTQFSEVLLRYMKLALDKIPFGLSTVGLVSALFSLSVSSLFGGLETPK